MESRLKMSTAGPVVCNVCSGGSNFLSISRKVRGRERERGNQWTRTALHLRPPMTLIKCLSKGLLVIDSFSSYFSSFFNSFLSCPLLLLLLPPTSTRSSPFGGFKFDSGHILKAALGFEMYTVATEALRWLCFLFRFVFFNVSFEWVLPCSVSLFVRCVQGCFSPAYLLSS